MSERRDSGTTITDTARRQAEERERRLAEALRANLRRRKAQSRARDEAEASLEGGTSAAKDGTDSAS